MKTRTSGLRGETYLRGAKLLLLVRHLMAGTSARAAAELVGVNKDTASKIGRMMREGKLSKVVAEARRLPSPVPRAALPENTDRSRAIVQDGTVGVGTHFASALVAALDAGDLEAAKIATEALAKLLKNVS